MITMRLPFFPTIPTILAALIALPAAASTPITLDQAMDHPDWIGTPVEAAWWSWDGKQVYYKQKRTGSPLRDTFQAGARPRLVADTELAKVDSPDVFYNPDRSRMLVLRNGDLFERNLKNGDLVQITRGASKLDAAQFTADGRGVQYRIGSDWYLWDRASKVVGPAALPRAAKDPAANDEDALRTMQLRLITTLKRQKDDREAMRARMDELRRIDPTMAPTPIYFGDKVEIENSSLSPSGRWLLVATAPKGSDKGRVGKMPRYVTESGYEEFDDQRTRVGRNMPAPHALKLVDLRTNKVHELSFDVLPGVNQDPLAELRAAAKRDPLKGNRAVRVIDSGDGISWSANGAGVAVMLRAVDNKDRRPGRRQTPAAAPPDRQGLGQLRQQRIRLAAGQPQPVVPVRGKRLLAPVHGGHRDRRHPCTHPGQVGSLGRALDPRRRHRLRDVQPRHPGRL